MKRMVFHEITPAAIRRAVEEWRELDRRLVDAQEARRILDRLYGYEVSPVLWKKVMPRLSAGRVQSVATRMVVERERARMRFRSATWWGVDGTFARPRRRRRGRDGAAAASRPPWSRSTGRRSPPGGTSTPPGGRSTAARPGADRGRGPGAGRRAGRADVHGPLGDRAAVPAHRRPPPFMTSTLQQEAGRKLRFSAQRAMQVAQRLYEQGWITYMRTDSTTLSDEALGGRPRPGDRALRRRVRPDRPPALRAQGEERPGGPRGHPAGRRHLPHPRGGLGQPCRGDELRLYDLIWKRTVASQMADATGHERPGAPGRHDARPTPPQLAGAEAEFSASGRVITFPGFLRAYVEGEDDPEAELADREVVLPPLVGGRRA